MFVARRLRRVACAIGVLAVTAVAPSLLLRFGPHVELVMKAAGIPQNASGIGGFINGAHALTTPALVMVAAVAPLALLEQPLIVVGRACAQQRAGMMVALSRHAAPACPRAESAST